MSGSNKPRDRSGPMLVAAKLWSRTSATGTDYLAGRLDGVRVIVMPRRDNDPGDHTRTLLCAKAPQREEGNQ